MSLKLSRVLPLLAAFPASALAETTLQDHLHGSGFQLVCESYQNNNWELMLSKADGSESVNLTNTPNAQELYPEVSPDGKRIAFVSDEGTGRDTVRSVWVMNIDGTERKKIADYARQPFWHPNSKVLCYLPQEFKKFNVVDYSTKGLMRHDLETGKETPHPNADLFHLYNPQFAPDGKWIVSTVHAGMGVDHGILLIEAEGKRVVNLGIPGCRPTLAPDGKHIAWGPGDHAVTVAPIDLSAETPAVGKPTLTIQDADWKTYHIAFSPDSQFVSLSRGPLSKGDSSKPGTHQSACEIVGVYAKDWDIYAVALQEGIVDFQNPADQDRIVKITKDGSSNKESSWVPKRP